MEEEWRFVKGYNGRYQVSSAGRVRTNSSGAWLLMSLQKPKAGKKGYLSVALAVSGKKTRFSVHRLVLEAFVGPCPEGCVACHNNGNPLDNSLYNLRWDTLASNQHDRVVHGTALCGTSHPSAKLTEEDVLHIRSLLSKGVPHRKLAKDFSVSRGLISYISSRAVWAHI